MLSFELEEGDGNIQQETSNVEVVVDGGCESGYQVIRRTGEQVIRKSGCPGRGE